jgi:phosphonate transport system substrate-binding protein
MSRVFAVVVCLCVAMSLGPLRASAEPPGSLVLGVHPYLQPSEIFGRFNPLARYLSDELGIPVVLEISTNYDTHIDRVGSGSVDIAFMAPVSYVRLVDTFGYVPLLAVMETGGRTSFKGYIVAREGAGLSGLADLKGRRFAFGDHTSTMSHYVPRFMLLEAGVDVADLAAYEYVGHHENVALGVLVGDFDAGGVKAEVFDEYLARGLVALAESRPYADHLFVANPNLDSAMVQSIREALLRLSGRPGGPTVLEGIKHGLTNLVPVEDAQYDTLRQMLRMLGAVGVKP